MTLTTAAAAAVATLLVSVIPAVHLAYMSPAGHVAIETAAGLIALLVAYLVLGRFLRTGEQRDLALTAALATLGFTNLLFSSIPLAASSGIHRFSTWAPVAGRLLGSFLFAVAAFVPARRLSRPREAVLPVTLACSVGLAAIALVFAVAAPHLPFGINPALSPTSPDGPRVVGNPAVLIVQIVSMLLFAFAAVGFVREREQTGDELLDWFAIGSVLAAFSHLNYFLFPSLYSNWVYMGDFLRLGFYLVLLVGAGREIAAYQRRMADTAALEERRRLARELHDGLAQELAFISTQSRWLAQSVTGDQGRLEQLALAAARALDESRSAIAALTRPLDEPLEVALAQAAEEVADRVGVKVRLELVAGVEVTATTRAALLRIVREAVTNTARHGKASEVTVSLEVDGRLELRISDNGVGFDPEERHGRGFGLMSMRERAQAVGGSLEVRSRIGEGTEIQVVIP